MPIAVNIRGTNGSGKSTVVRRIMEAHRAAGGEVHALTRARGRRPLGYVLARGVETPIFIPGHYETACGGCDTIKTVNEVYGLVIDHMNRGHHALYEGIMVQDDVRRAVLLSRLYPLHVIGLDVPIDECLAAVRARREARGEMRPLNEANTRNRARSLERTMRRLTDEGIPNVMAGREAAVRVAADLLGAPL